MTSRRGFLAALVGALTLDPERLLWRPGSRLISIPRPRSGNLILTPAIFSRLVLMDLQKNLHIARNINNQYLNSFKGNKIGSTISVKRPRLMVQ